MKIVRLFAVLAVSATLLGVLPASAGPTIRLFDGTTTVTVTDGGLGDMNPTAGVVVFIGVIGDWLANTTTGLSNPITVGPHIDLNSVNASNITAASGFLDVYLTDINFTLGGLGPQLSGFLGLIGGTTNGTTTWEMFVDDGNNPFGLTTLIGTDSSTGPTFVDTFSGAATVDGTFSMTLHVRIVHGNGPGQLTSFNFEGRAAPEPNTLALIGVALLGVALIGRRRRS